MKKVAITARAKRFVEEWAKWFEMEQGAGFVPLIMWQVTDSSNRDFVPQLTLGFERREIVDPSRAMACEGPEVEIYQYAPDDLFGTDGHKGVDVRDDTLVIIDDLAVQAVSGIAS